MQTNFTAAQLADPGHRVSEKILRTCVHCGFCTATCPTYVLLGDELDSPRGRIYLIKDMLENDRPATPEVVKHIDRCLSCLSCMTTCPRASTTCIWSIMPGAISRRRTSGRGSTGLLRRAFGIVLPNPKLFRASMWLARLGAPFAGLMPAQLKAALALVPSRLPAPSPVDKPQVFKSRGFSRRRSGRESPIDRRCKLLIYPIQDGFLAKLQDNILQMDEACFTHPVILVTMTLNSVSNPITVVIEITTLSVVAFPTPSAPPLTVRP